MDITLLAQSGARSVLHFRDPPQASELDLKESPATGPVPPSALENLPEAGLESPPAIPSNLLKDLQVRPWQEVTIGHVKAHLLQAWPEGFADPPADASFIRLIHGGKVLDVSVKLASLVQSYQDPEAPASTTPQKTPYPLIMHISVRPASSVPAVPSPAKLKHSRRWQESRAHSATSQPEQPQSTTRPPERTTGAQRSDGQSGSCGCCLVM